MKFAKPALVDGNQERVRIRYAPSVRARGWPLVLVALIAPVLYLMVHLFRSPIVEATGYIVPDPYELHIAAYVPQSHPEYAHPGQQATVVFPDGTRRFARVTDVAQKAAREVPLAEAYAGAPLGVLVRMDFVDPNSGIREEDRKSGLPVRVLFPKHWFR